MAEGQESPPPAPPPGEAPESKPQTLGEAFDMAITEATTRYLQEIGVPEKYHEVLSRSSNFKAAGLAVGGAISAVSSIVFATAPGLQHPNGAEALGAGLAVGLFGTAVGILRRGRGNGS